MRISDWSSDVCSSDLRPGQETPRPGRSPPNALYPWGKKQEGAAISTKGGRQGSTGGNPMKKCLQGLALAVAAGVALGGGAAAAAGLKIGMITTLSGGGSGLGIDVRAGFMLALKPAGAVGVEVRIADDAKRPERGRAA